MITKYVLAVLLVNPTTHADKQKFFMYNTLEECVSVKELVLDKETQEMRRAMPDGFQIITARCNPVDLTNYGFERPLSYPHNSREK